MVYGTGDNTAGPIWRLTIEPNGVLGTYERYTNYPSGETLASPVNDVSALQSVVVWGLSKAVGPICAYNLTNIGGFMASALTMFGFIYSLTRRRWIAWLAGYIFAFTPYFQAQVGGHPGYGYTALLIGAVWAFFSLVRKPKWTKALLLTVLLTACFYWDPYFSLLVSTLMAPIGLVWLVWRYHKRPAKTACRNYWLQKDVKFIALSLGLVVLALLPLAYAEIYQSGQINNQVGAARGSVLEAAEICSNYPQSYFLPFAYNPFYVKLVGSHANGANAYFSKYSKCGYAEDGVGLSWAAMVVICAGAIAILGDWRGKRKTGLGTTLSYPPVLVLGGVAVAGLVAVLIGLPPFHILGLPLPSRVIIHFTSTWRVFAREYVDVNLCLTVLFAAALAYFSNRFRTRPKVLVALFVVIFLGVFVQYQAFSFYRGNTVANFNYNNIPRAYNYIKNNKSIKTIAEYPMEPTSQSSSNEYYLTMQTLYKKPLRNSSLSDGPGEMLDASIRNLGDPQTVSVLHGLGISTVVVHGLTVNQVAQIPYLKVIYSETGVAAYRLLDNSKGLLVIAQIVGAPTPQKMLQFSSALPVNGATQLSPTQWPYEIPNDTVLDVVDISSAASPVAAPFEACFDIKMAGQGDTGQLNMVIDSKNTVTTNLTDSYLPVHVMANKTIKLDVTNGHNMRITGLGCSS